MENDLGRIAKCRYKTKMEFRSGFCRVDLTTVAQELLAFITPKSRVFKGKVMDFRGHQRPSTLPGTDEQKCVHIEVETSRTRVDFSRG